MTARKPQQRQFDKFLDGALDAALWSNHPTPPEGHNDPVEYADEYDPAPGAIHTLRAVIAAAARPFFVEQYPRLLVMAREAAVREGWAEVGHCFMLDAEGHGTGFMDRAVPRYITEPLSDAAREYEGTVNLYLDEEGLLRVEPGNVIPPEEGGEITLDPLVCDALAHLSDGLEEWGVSYSRLPEPRLYSSERDALRAVAAINGVRSAWQPRAEGGGVEEPVIWWRVAPAWREVEIDT